MGAVRTAAQFVWERILVERGFDQADGLRRMFGGTRTRVLDIVSGSAGVGRTSVAVNLGAALARRGRNTLLVDFVPRAAVSRVHRYFGLASVPDAVSSTVALPVAHGYGVATLSHREWIQGGPMPASVFSISGPAREGAMHDWLLINGAGVDPVVVTEEGVREVLIVISGAAASITDAYGLLKRIVTSEHRCRYAVLVNRVNSAQAAGRIFANMAQVARGYLDVTLEFIGFIPADLAVQRAAAECASVIDSEPASAAAQAYTRLAELIGTPSVMAKPRHFGLVVEPSLALGAA